MRYWDGRCHGREQDSGIRAGLGHHTFSAHQGVEHDDANTIAMGAWVIGAATAREVITTFLAARFDATEEMIFRVEKLRRLGLSDARELLERGADAERPTTDTRA